MRTTAAVIRAEPGNVRAYAARGHALCLKLDFDQGMKHVREGLRLDPDHAECASLFRRMKRAGAALDRGRTAAGTRDFEVRRDRVHRVARCRAGADALPVHRGGVSAEGQRAAASEGVRAPRSWTAPPRSPRRRTTSPRTSPSPPRFCTWVSPRRRLIRSKFYSRWTRETRLFGAFLFFSVSPFIIPSTYGQSD